MPLESWTRGSIWETLGMLRASSHKCVTGYVALPKRCLPLETCIPCVNRESLSGQISSRDFTNILLECIYKDANAQHASAFRFVNIEDLPTLNDERKVICYRDQFYRIIAFEDFFPFWMKTWLTELISIWGISGNLVSPEQRGGRRSNGHLKRYRTRTRRARQVDDASGMTLLMVIPSWGRAFSSRRGTPQLTRRISPSHLLYQ